MSHGTRNSESIGERLRRKREELGLSAEELAQEIQAPVKFVAAFENDAYDVFPAKVYALGFLKKTVTMLAMEDAESLVKEFTNEWDIRMFRKQKELTPLPGSAHHGSVITPGRVGMGVIVLLFLFSVVFFGSRLTKFVGTPELSIEEPLEEAVFSEPTIVVKGRTEKESRLTVNGQELKIDESGFFHEELELSSGIHSLEFLVLNRFGKKRTEVRNVIIK